jgi:copper chaperone CopZ
MAYIVAGISALGIALWISGGRTPDSSVSATGGETLVLHVPKMHCEAGCYSVVQRTLKEQPGVTEVALAKQSGTEGLDNPRVFVTVAKGVRFDQDQALEALAKLGFGDSSVER